MKLSRSLFIVLIVVIISANCWGDWKSEITSLGFYAVSNGKAIPLTFVNLGNGETARPLLLKDFQNIPSLKSGDFLILFGDMPTGPFGTAIEVFKYEPAYTTFTFRKNLGEVNDFFSIEPMDSLKGQKLFKINCKSSEPGNYFLHKFVGENSDSYAGFRIGDGGKVSEASSPTTKVPPANLPYDVVLEKEKIIYLDKALALLVGAVELLNATDLIRSMDEAKENVDHAFARAAIMQAGAQDLTMHKEVLNVIRKINSFIKSSRQKYAENNLADGKADHKEAIILLKEYLKSVLPPSQEKVTETSSKVAESLPKKPSIEATTANLRLYLARALENLSERDSIWQPTKDRIGSFRKKNTDCLNQAVKLLETASEIAINLGDVITTSSISDWTSRTKNVREMFITDTKAMKSFDEQKKLVKEINLFLKQSN